MGFFKKALNAIKNWVTGGSSKSSKSKSSKSSSSSKKSSRSSSSGSSYSSSGSYYGGGTRKAFKAQLDEEERKRKQKDEQLKNAFKANASMSSSSSSSSSSSEKKTPPDPKQQAFKASQKRITKKLSEIEAKQTEDPKEALRKKARQKREAERAAYNKATQNKYNVEKNGSEARRAQKNQAYDVNAEKYEMKAHPIATSAGRGALSGVTFGGSELMAQTSKNRRKSGAEEFYQKNKSKKAEMAGEIAGTLASFGLTSGASSAVGKKVASKVAPKLMTEGTESAVKYLAKSPAFRKAAEKEMKRTGIKVTEDVIERAARQRAERLVSSIGEDMAVNMTTGGAMDLNQSIRDSIDEDGKVDWKNVPKEMGTNALMNLGLGGAVTVAPALRTSKGIIRRGARDDAADLARKITAEERERIRKRLSEQSKKGRQLRDALFERAEDAERELDRGFTLPENRIDTRNGRLPANQVDASRLSDDIPRMRDSGSIKADNEARSKALRRDFLDRAMQRGNAESGGRMRLQDMTNIPDIAVGRIDNELAALNNEIRLKRNTATDEELMRLNDRFDQLMSQRKALTNPETREEEQLANALRKNAVAGRQARRGPEALSEAESASMRNAFLGRAEDAERNLDNGFVLPNDARTAPTDSGATSINIRGLADERQAARDANRRNVLDGLLANARANEPQREARPLGDLVNIRTADDAARNTRLGEINTELEQVQREILLKRNTAPAEELDALNNRFSELLDERRAIETPPSLEQQRSALQEERDNLFAEYQAARNDDSVSPLELQGMLDDMQEMDLELRDLDAQISRANVEPPRAEAPAPQTAEAPRQTVEPRAELPTPRAEARPTPPPTREAAAEAPNINEGNVPRPEPPRAETTAPTAEAPQRPLTQEEAIREARETQTRKESEDLMMAHFEETGEADLGMYGKVTPNGDGTYHVKIEGVDREIDIPKEEVERRIKESTKRAYDEPKVVDSLEDVVYKRHERASFRERLKKAWGMGRQMISDSLASFEDTERALAREQGRQVDYGAINEVRAHQAKANRSISNKQLDWQGNKYEGFVERVGADGQVYRIENGKSIADIYKGMDEETERAFDLYLELRHAPDRLLEGKPVFDNIVDKSGRNFNSATACTEEADRILAEHPEFAQKAEEIYQYTRNELQNRVDAGLLTQQTFDDWFSRYPNYVPTHREGFNEIHGVSGSTVGATEIKGAKGSDRGIMSIRDQLTAATTRNWRDMSTNEMFRRYFGDRIASDLAQDADGGIERVLDNTINLGKNESSGKYFADIYIKGKKHTVELEDRFYEGLKDLYKNGMTGNALFDTTNEAFSKVAGVWKNLITEWSPIFMVKNGMRDFPEAVINSRQTKEFLECMGPARRDLATGGQFSEALRDAGISQSSFIDLDKAIREGKDKASLLARANGAVEMFPRLCEYMATLKKEGIDITDPNAIKKASRELKARAAANAADVTVNFGRSGSVGKMINKGLVPFFNPSVQGWSKFVRNVTENRGDTKALLSFAVKATALGAGATTFNNFMLQDNDNYQQISARDKANNYIIPLGDPDTTNMFIKIPSSRFASVYGLPMVNAFNENKMGWAEAIKVANDQVAPIDPIESTLFRPFIDAAKNETWYGTPIVGGALEDLPPSEQYDPNTSAIGKALGRATQNLPRELQISPKKADYIIDAETGVAGDFILPMATPSKQGGGKGLLGKTLPAAGNVLRKQFTIDSNTQNDLSSRFYKQLEDATVSKNSSKATAKDQAEYKRLSAYKDEVSGLTKAITDLQNGDRATKQDDIYGLQKVRNKLIQDALNGKQTPSTAKKIDAVQKYVGTTYAIENFGSSTDKEAMKVYGASVYGNISEKEMQQKIDADKDFYKGVRAVGKLEDKLAKATGSKATSALSRSVALAEIGASDELFGAYEGTKKSRTETDIKMNRARNYISDGGSSDEFIKLEKTRKTLGKLSDYDKEAELDKALADLKSNQISEAEYYQRQGEINYNANISYVGLATSLAQANAPSRGYVLYDIKAKNVQKGINLAAMGFTARDYREMAKAVDADGNGYPKKQEIIDYVNSRDDIEDKATLYDALYYYKSSRNPFGAPTNYSRDDAAAVGKKNGVEQISDETGDLKLKDDEESKSGYGYRRRGYRRWRRWGRGGGKAKTPALRTDSAFKAKAKLPNSKTSSSSSASSKAPTVKRSYKSMASSSRTSKTTNVNMRGLKLTPPTPKKKGGKKS